MWTIAKRLVLLLLLAAIPAHLAAQTTATIDAPREGVALGIALTPGWTGTPEFWPAARLTVPLVARVGLDVDAGRMYPASNRYFSTAAFYSVGVRFLRSRREADGSTRYWILGPAYVVGREFDGTGQVSDPHRVIPAFKLGYGGDQVFRNGVRAGGEFGVIGGNGDSPTGVYATLVVQWQPRR